MQKSLSTTGILDLGNMEKYVKYIAEAGFGGMELDLCMFYAEYDLESHGTEHSAANKKRLYEYFNLLVEQGRKYSVCFDAVRAPYMRWDTKRTDLNDLLLQIGEKSIRVCKEIRCHYVIVQPLFSGIAKQDRWEKNFEFYLKFGKLAKENNICVLMENQCDYINGHPVRGMCSDIDTLSRFIDMLNGELGGDILGFCLNTEVCDLCGQDMGEMAAGLGERLKAILVKEYDDGYGIGRLPGVGGNSRKWFSLIQGLRRIEYDGLFIMDAGNALRGFSHLLRSQLYPVIKSVADFFCWQIEMERQLKKYPVRALFGAGKMCHNYMKYYGKSYPPIFICDNNPRLWGTQVEGLDVKPPEVLGQLPENGGVIICNVFYDEIARQIRAMGIQNIAAFNDEYMRETMSGKLCF